MEAIMGRKTFFIFIARVLAVLVIVLAGASATWADPVCPPEDPNVEYSSTEFKDGCPVIAKGDRQRKPRSSPEPEDSCPTRGSSRIDVEAMVENPTTPPSDLKLGVQDLARMAKVISPRASERLRGKYLLGLTVHLDGDQPTNFPFPRFYPAFQVERSRQGKHLCISVLRIRLEYAPLHVYVAREMSACEDVISAHERQHYAYLDNLDTGLAAFLSSRFNALGLPTPAQPKMIPTTQIHVDFVKNAVRVKILTELGNVIRGKYREIANLQQEQLDTVAESARMCGICDKRGAPFCRRAATP